MPPNQCSCMKDRSLRQRTSTLILCQVISKASNSSKVTATHRKVEREPHRWRAEQRAVTTWQVTHIYATRNKSDNSRKSNSSSTSCRSKGQTNSSSTSWTRNTPPISTRSRHRFWLCKASKHHRACSKWREVVKRISWWRASRIAPLIWQESWLPTLSYPHARQAYKTWSWHSSPSRKSSLPRQPRSNPRECQLEPALTTRDWMKTLILYWWLNQPWNLSDRGSI